MPQPTDLALHDGGDATVACTPMQIMPKENVVATARLPASAAAAAASAARSQALNMPPAGNCSGQITNLPAAAGRRDALAAARHAEVSVSSPSGGCGTGGDEAFEEGKGLAAVMDSESNVIGSWLMQPTHLWPLPVTAAPAAAAGPAAVKDVITAPATAAAALAAPPPLAPLLPWRRGRGLFTASASASRYEVVSLSSAMFETVTATALSARRFECFDGASQASFDSTTTRAATPYDAVLSSASRGDHAGGAPSGLHSCASLPSALEERPSDASALSGAGPTADLCEVLRGLQASLALAKRMLSQQQQQGQGQGENGEAARLLAGLQQQAAALARAAAAPPSSDQQQHRQQAEQQQQQQQQQECLRGEPTLSAALEFPTLPAQDSPRHARVRYGQAEDLLLAQQQQQQQQAITSPFHSPRAASLVTGRSTGSSNGRAVSFRDSMTLFGDEDGREQVQEQEQQQGQASLQQGEPRLRECYPGSVPLPAADRSWADAGESSGDDGGPLGRPCHSVGSALVAGAQAAAAVDAAGSAAGDAADGHRPPAAAHGSLERSRSIGAHASAPSLLPPAFEGLSLALPQHMQQDGPATSPSGRGRNQHVTVGPPRITLKALHRLRRNGSDDGGAAKRDAAAPAATEHAGGHREAKAASMIQDRFRSYLKSRSNSVGRKHEIQLTARVVDALLTKQSSSRSLLGFPKGSQSLTTRTNPGGKPAATAADTAADGPASRKETDMWARARKKIEALRTSSTVAQAGSFSAGSHPSLPSLADIHECERASEAGTSPLPIEGHSFRGGSSSLMVDSPSPSQHRGAFALASLAMSHFLQRGRGLRLEREGSCSGLSPAPPRRKQAPALFRLFTTHRFVAPCLHFLTAQYQRLTNSADVRVRVALLVTISIANVTVGATLYRAVTGSDWRHALFTVYTILFNVPGTDVTEEASIAATLVVNVIFIIGILVFAVLLGMVGEEVANQIVSLRSGTGPLRLRGHILILNTNEDMITVLSQITAAARRSGHPFHKRAIVLLADVDKDTLNTHVNKLLSKGTKGLKDAEIHTRSGLPYSINDLKMVSAAQAAYVVLLYPVSASTSAPPFGPQAYAGLARHSMSGAGWAFHADQGRAESLKAATIAALSTLSKGRSKQHLVVQDGGGLETWVPNEIPPEYQHLEAVQELLAADGAAVQVVRIPETKVVDRLLAQTALQPGVTTVIKNVLRQGKDYTFVFLDVTPYLSGVPQPPTFGSLRRCFPDVAVLGYQRCTPSTASTAANRHAGGAANTPFARVSMHDEEEELGSAAGSNVAQAARPPFARLYSASSLPFESMVLNHGGGAGPSGAPAGHKRITVNPEDGDLMQPGDKLVAVARSEVADDPPWRRKLQAASFTAGSKGKGKSAAAAPSPVCETLIRASALAIHRVAKMSTEQVMGRRLLVVGWPGTELDEFIQGLRGFAAPGTHVTFVFPEDPAMCSLPELTEDDNITMECMQMEVTMSEDNFLRGGIALADTVVVGVPRDMHYPDSDARVLSALIQIQRVASSLRHHVHVVAKACAINTKRVAKRFMRSLSHCYVTHEVVIPNQITSAILTQVLWQPAMIDLVVELMVVGEGNELYILELDQLGFRPGQRVLFGEVVEAGRLLSMSVLGYSRQDGLKPILAPSASAIVEFQKGDKVVVVADLVT